MNISKSSNAVTLRDGTSFAINGKYYHDPSVAMQDIVDKIMNSSGCSSKEAFTVVDGNKTLTGFIDDCLANPTTYGSLYDEGNEGKVQFGENMCIECEHTSGGDNCVDVCVLDMSAASKANMDEYTYMAYCAGSEFYFSDPRNGKMYALIVNVD
jgi:hypothetical protein